MDSSTNISNRASSTLSEVDSRFKAPIHSCDVIQLATELLHSSSSESELKQLKKQLSMIEKHIAEFVDVYFEGFNKSIRSHTNILQQLMIAQKGVSDLTETLTDSSEILQCKNDDLVKLWKSHIENLGILSLVDQIKWLITVPSDSKSYLSQAYPLHSALLLRKGIQCIRPLEAVQGITELSAQLFAERKKVCDFAQKSILAAMYLQITERGNTELKRKDLFLPLHRNGANYRRMNYPHQYEGSINDAVIAEDEDLNETLSPNTELFLKNSIHAVFLLDKEEEVSKEIVEGVAEKFEEFLNSNLKIQNIVSSLYPSEKTIEELRSYLSQFSGKIVSVLHNYSLIAKYYSLFEKNYHSDDKSTFPILSIWNRMQDILISFLRISVLGEVFVSSVPRGDNEVKQNKLFSFSNNVVANNDHSSFFANGSPKYMFAVFPFLESIQNSAIQILQSIYPSVQLQTNTHTHLVSFAREFTQQCFVAGASQEGRERCRKLLDSIHSADLVYTRYGMIMKSAIDMIGLVTQLHTDALRLKAARKVFYKLVCSFCSRFISKCEDLFGTLAGKMDSNDPESESDEKSLKFTMRLMNERTTPFDFKKSQFAEIGPKSDKSANSSKDKKKSEKAMNFDQFYDINYALSGNELRDIYYGFRSNCLSSFDLPLKSLVFDSNSFITLIVLSNSLEYFCDELLSTFSDPAINESKREKLMKKEIEKLSKKAQELSDKILYFFHVEIRIHCFYFLSKFKGTSYNIDSTSIQAEDFIVSFNKDILNFEEALQGRTTDTRITFVFEGLSWLVCDLFIRSLKFISNVNANGARKLLRNVFVFKQNLTITVMKKEFFFDRAIKYFSLINLTESELITFVNDQRKQSTHMFDLESYRIIFEKKRLTSETINKIESLI